MTGFLIPLILRLGIPERFARAAAWAVIVVGAILAAWLALTLHDRSVIDDHERDVAAALAPKIAAGADKAAAERAADAIATAATEQELTNAVSSLPDEPPSPRRVALGCERLRRAGQALPAACR